MKKIIETDESEGLEKLIGEVITVWCMNYIYAGKLSVVNATCILLTDASIVYETGELCAKGDFKDAQKLPGDWYVQIAAIESFGKLR